MHSSSAPLRATSRSLAPRHASQIISHRTSAAPSTSLAFSASPASSPASQFRQSPRAQPRSQQNFSIQPLAMSRMPASHGHNEACCNIPPVVSKGYQAKGTYEQIGEFKTYVTGPADATKAIVIIYDIFGYFDQTLQGADILAYSDKNQKYKVFMPDLFHGEPCPIEIYPPDNEDKQKQLGAFFEKFPPPKVAAQVPGYVQAIKDKNASLSKFGILGFCWGGKVVALSVKADSNPFAIAASAHPAMVDAADAEGVKIPFALLASKEEPPEDVKKFEDALKVPKHVETFGDQIHGWMAARADLDDARVKEEYERGYKTVLDFFGKNF